MLLNTEQMRYFGAIIMEQNAKCLRIALLDIKNNPHKETLKHLFKTYALEFAEITESSFLTHLQALEQEEILQALLQKINQEIKQEFQEKESSIQEFVRFVLQRAVLERASDVHFELDLEYMRVRFRIDGVLVEKLCLESWVFAPISASIKLLAHLNLTESKLPQDGRFSLEFFKEQIFDIQF